MEVVLSDEPGTLEPCPECGRQDDVCEWCIERIEAVVAGRRKKQEELF